jgi:hypothetical protein
MEIKKAQGYPCHKYRQSKSPIRPWGVLLHSTEGGGMAYLDELFIKNLRDDGVTVSVHFCVFQNGEIHQYAPWEPGEAWYCYHAGSSSWGDATNMAEYLIGIEMQHMCGQPYYDAQLDSVEALLKHIQAAYRSQPYWRDLLLEHRQVSPGRKTDPTAPWDDGPRQRIRDAWHREEGFMGLTDEEQRELLNLTRLNRVSLIAACNTDEIVIAMANGEMEEALSLFTEANAAAQKERARLFKED